MPYFKNNDTNILFIHIPKTGGTSLESYFEYKFNIPLDSKSLYMWLDEEQKQNNTLIDTSLQHITYQTMFKYNTVFNIDPNGLKIITIVRNPYERLISDLFFNKLITINSSKEEVFNIIKTYLLRNDLDNHNLPQYVFVTNDNKKLVPNIQILHTETLTTDMHNLGYEDFDKRDNKNSINIDYYKYLNNDSIKLINDFYDCDFTLFNYTKQIACFNGSNRCKSIKYFS